MIISSTQPEMLPMSVIIPVYNGTKTLPDTLQSVAQLEGKFELLVVDDGSTDNTADMARAAGAQVISLEKNSGPATARNRGGREASGEILLFTDSDVLVPKSLLINLLERFQQSGADAVQGTFSEVCPFGNYFSQYKNLYNRYVINQMPDWIDTTFTSITAVKREAFLKCGGFDEKIRTASIEDRTLGRNLTRAGSRIYLDRRLEVVHNKKLTFKKFLRNQFARSRDLAKFMLRLREEKKKAPTPAAAATSPQEQKGRFGTNSMATMMRIPVLYAGIAFAIVALYIPIFWALAIFLGVIYLHLISGFELYLLQKRGLGFALKGIPVNMMDAFTSGLGILCGLWGYWVRGRKY